VVLCMFSCLVGGHQVGEAPLLAGRVPAGRRVQAHCGRGDHVLHVWADHVSHYQVGHRLCGQAGRVLRGGPVTFLMARLV
jgi:hypothetical protein